MLKSFRLNNQVDEALQVMEIALERYPKQPQLLNNLGNMLLGQEEADSAIQAYQDALLPISTRVLPAENLASSTGNMNDLSLLRNFESGIKLPHPSSPLLITSMWYRLQTGDSIQIPTPSGSALEDPLLMYNYQLIRHNSRDTLGRGVIGRWRIKEVHLI